MPLLRRCRGYSLVSAVRLRRDVFLLDVREGPLWVLSTASVSPLQGDGRDVVTWPVVLAGEPALRGGEVCFYCRRNIGQEHARDCVCVRKRVLLGFVAKMGERVLGEGTWEIDEPHAWDAHDIEFHKNESSWCLNNFLSAAEGGYGQVVWKGEPAWEELSKLASGEGCLCTKNGGLGVLTFTFLRVVDPTPRMGED